MINEIEHSTTQAKTDEAKVALKFNNMSE